MTGAIFLDRDGVINRRPPDGGYVSSWSEFHFLPGAVDALADLARRSSRPLYVVTNQRGVALGRMSAATVEGIHAAMRAELARHGVTLAGIKVCVHDVGTCTCRKPQTGLFEQLFRENVSLDRAESAVVGDSASDVVAAHRLHVPAYLVGERARDVAKDAIDHGYGVRGCAPSLAELVRSGALDGARNP